MEKLKFYPEPQNLCLGIKINRFAKGYQILKNLKLFTNCFKYIFFRIFLRHYYRGYKKKKTPWARRTCTLEMFQRKIKILLDFYTFFIFITLSLKTYYFKYFKKNNPS